MVLNLVKPQKPKTITVEQLNDILLSLKTKQLEQLEQINNVIEMMPLFGEMRETNKKLSFGQYLTVLSEWWNTVQHTLIDVVREVNQIV